ncbi:MAG: exodeoxyribonuclease large subunit [Vampirovibrio sp.]|jgi:exodeoxyribonuclease VII large subunit|nr:exodeoxyribonuclease large subunit [Vampirovibrio sp.]
MPRGKAPKSKSTEPSQQTLDFTAIMVDGALKKASYSVSEITAMLEDAIDEHPTLGGTMVVQGELSNVKRSSRGHVYFTLKDEEASIGGILWASTANRLTFDLEDGLEVYLTGRLEIYRPSGSYSIVGSKMEPVGVGALQLAFQQIKARLEAEGLFMEEFKKPIPEFPERIGIITSSTGAVIHDMLRVIRRKNPLVDVLLAPVKVQGEGAALEIAQAILELNEPQYNLDVIIVARGGGSFEDLFCFSEEVAVRMVFESRIPIITGIGHEPDYSLCDAAADYSASTPTAAADWAVPDIQLLIENHSVLARDLLENMAELILYYEQTLDHSATRLIETHESCLDSCGHKLEQRSERLQSQFNLYFQKQEQRLGEAAAVLDAYNPLATMARGYGITTDARLNVIRSIRQVQPGDALTVRVQDGEIACQVQDTKPI